MELDMTRLQGLLDYLPEEFTFTAWAGSRVSEIQQLLAEHGQYLPFDPILVEQGATLGGTVASGLSGPGRYRYGGLRDFILGVKFIDGQGNLVRSGAKVVKNAAGFDLSKFMVGSLGHYGLLVECTFKVFPRPAACMTVRADYPTLEDAFGVLVRLAAAPLELYSLDLHPENGSAALLLRIGGQPEILAGRMARVEKMLAEMAVKPGQIQALRDTADAELWRSATEFSWVDGEHTLVKVPLTPSRLLSLDRRLAQQGATRRYSAGANLAWVAWPGSLQTLDEILAGENLSGLAVLGETGQPWIGMRGGSSFAQRVRKALDPFHKFSADI
jgi:glycolate oxidase FAD binding subunit